MMAVASRSVFIFGSDVADHEQGGLRKLAKQGWRAVTDEDSRNDVV